MAQEHKGRNPRFCNYSPGYELLSQLGRAAQRTPCLQVPLKETGAPAAQAGVWGQQIGNSNSLHHGSRPEAQHFADGGKELNSSP